MFPDGDTLSRIGRIDARDIAVLSVGADLTLDLVQEIGDRRSGRRPFSS